MDFRKAFFPTNDELKVYDNQLQEINGEREAYFKDLGFTDSDINVIEAIETKELSNTHRFQSYSSRYSLLQNGIITVDKVRADIEEYQKLIHEQSF